LNFSGYDEIVDKQLGIWYGANCYGLHGIHRLTQLQFQVRTIFWSGRTHTYFGKANIAICCFVHQHVSAGWELFGFVGVADHLQRTKRVINLGCR
jgi:hypothetical protein